MSLPPKAVSATLAGISDSGCLQRIQGREGVVGSYRGKAAFLDGSDEFPLIVPRLKNVRGARSLIVADERGRLHRMGELEEIGNGILVFKSGQAAVKPLGSALVELDASLIQESQCGADFVGLEGCNTPGVARLVRMSPAKALTKLNLCGLEGVTTLDEDTDVVVLACTKDGLVRLKLTKEIMSRFLQAPAPRPSGLKMLTRIPLVRQYTSNHGINSYVDDGGTIGSSSGTINLGIHGVPNSASIVYLLLQAGVALYNQSTANATISINGVTWAHVGMSVGFPGAQSVDRVCYVAPIPITSLSMAYNVDFSVVGSSDDACMATISLVGYYVP